MHLNVYSPVTIENTKVMEGALTCLGAGFLTSMFYSALRHMNFGVECLCAEAYFFTHKCGLFLL